MKTYVIPMLLIVKADNIGHAENEAAKLQAHAQRASIGALFVDEGIPAKVIPALGPDQKYEASILCYYDRGELQ